MAALGRRMFPRPVRRPGGGYREVRHPGRPINVMQEQPGASREAGASQEKETSAPLVDLNCSAAVWYPVYSYGRPP